MIPEGHSVIVGASGAGKTVTAKVEVERLLSEGRHTCIIDPTGVWHGLRALADGVGAGFAIPIFGGLHGDLPIRWTQGAAVGAIISSGVSAILDVSQMDSTEQQQFVGDFVAALRQKPRGNFHLIVDEADEFAPQTSPSSAGEACKRQMEWIAKRGRVQGFVLMAITQRVADIAKSVISQTQTVIVHQLIAPADKNAIRAYLRDNATKVVLDEVLSNLAGLAKGERYIFNPQAERLERGFSPMPKTFDTSRTPLPGETAAQPQGLAEIDIAAIKAALIEPEPEADNAEPAGDYSIQLKALRTELARVTEQRDRLAADMGYGQRQLIFLSEALRQIGKVVEAALAADGMERPNALRIDQVYEIPAEGGGGPEGDEGQTEAADVSPRAKPQRQRADPQGVTAGKTATDLTRSAGKMLAVCAQNYPRALKVEHIAKMAGVSTASSQWRNNLRSFQDSGLVEEMKPGLWRLSSFGARDYEVSHQCDDPEKAFAFWQRQFAPGTARMLSVIRDSGTPLKRDVIADLAGLSRTSSGVGSGLRELLDHDLIIMSDGRYAIGSALT